MNILVIGGGGREHSIVWALERSKESGKIYCSPGNAGISKIAICTKINLNDKEDIFNFCLSKKIELVIIGPEEYLEKGVSDYLNKREIKVFGPSKKASRLESSKVFSKKFLKKYKIPTSNSKSFTNYENASNYLKSVEYPIVIKADGLASGKGVFISKNFLEAKNALKELMIKKKLGDSGKKILIEDFLEGFEISYFVFIDQKNYLPLGYALDHKKAYDNDQGPNTGGMGCFLPSKQVSNKLIKKIESKIVIPTVNGIRNENFIYRGVLFIGLMITEQGPSVIEYNVRFGDPECQTLLRNLDTDFLEIISSCVNDKLSQVSIKKNNKSVICVVLASKGYPGRYKKNSILKNLNSAEEIDNVIIFHAGTNLKNNKILSSGGRVLSVTSTGKDIKDAREKVYKAIKEIKWKEGFFRKDIGIKNF